MGVLIALGSAIMVLLGVFTFLVVRMVSGREANRVTEGTNNAQIVPVASEGTPSTAPTIPSPIVPNTAGSEGTVIEPAGPGFRQVMLVTIPNDAHLKRGDIDIGLAPFPLSLKPGETAQITVTHDNYIPQTITIDGSKGDRQVITLQRIPSAQPARTAPAPSAKPVAPTPPPPPPKCKQGQHIYMGDCWD